MRPIVPISAAQKIILSAMSELNSGKTAAEAAQAVARRFDFLGAEQVALVMSEAEGARMGARALTLSTSGEELVGNALPPSITEGRRFAKVRISYNEPGGTTGYRTLHVPYDLGDTIDDLRRKAQGAFDALMQPDAQKGDDTVPFVAPTPGMIIEVLAVV